MSTLLLNTAVAAVALVVILAVWGGTHLLARKRLGDRKLGCKGPTPEPDGTMMCCKGGGKICESGTGKDGEQGE